jgi:hypothetical protein
MLRPQADKKMAIMQAALLGGATFLSRYLTRGQLYFVDGPAIVRSIREHIYVIQPPGYWMLAHLGGMFKDPVSGLLLANELFSAIGVVVFYLLCLELNISRTNSFLAAAAYSSVFYVWMAGDIHSSYASQILFAPLLAYALLRYRDAPSAVGVFVCGVIYSIGAGMRPSDGAFMAPLVLFLGLKFVNKPNHRMILLSSIVLFCLAWYIPTQIAYHRAKENTLSGQVASLASLESPIIAGINPRSLGNILRVIVPLLAAFWMLLPVLFELEISEVFWLALCWAIPGLTFMALIYMADPTYLTFLTGAIILLAVTSKKKSQVAISLTLCIFFNSVLFLAARPIRSESQLGKIANFYVVKYCNYGIQHRWSSTLRSGGSIPE